MRVEEETSLFKYAAINGMIRSALVQYSTLESHKKINAGGINQQPMDAVTAAVANCININVQSIFKQYTKRQQPMNAKLTSVHSASTSMLRVSTANAHRTKLPYARFFQDEDFHSLQYASHPCHSVQSRRLSRRVHPPRKYSLPGCVG